MILLYVLAVACYSMFLWASIMASDNFVRTHEWYLVLLLYLLGHVLAFGEVAIFVVAIPLYIQFMNNWHKKHHKKRPPRIYMLMQRLNFVFHIAFFTYTMTYVIMYILRYKNIRDIFLMAIFSTALLILAIYATYFNKMKKLPGFYSQTFSHRIERFPQSF